MCFVCGYYVSEISVVGGFTYALRHAQSIISGVCCVQQLHISQYSTVYTSFLCSFDAVAEWHKNESPLRC